MRRDEAARIIHWIQWTLLLLPTLALLLRSSATHANEIADATAVCGVSGIYSTLISSSAMS